MKLRFLSKEEEKCNVFMKPFLNKNMQKRIEISFKKTTFGLRSRRG